MTLLYLLAALFLGYGAGYARGHARGHRAGWSAEHALEAQALDARLAHALDTGEPITLPRNPHRKHLASMQNRQNSPKYSPVASSRVQTARPNAPPPKPAAKPKPARLLDAVKVDDALITRGGQTVHVTELGTGADAGYVRVTTDECLYWVNADGLTPRSYHEAHDRVNYPGFPGTGAGPAAKDVEYRDADDVVALGARA